MSLRLILVAVLVICFGAPVSVLAQAPSSGATPPANTILINNHQFNPPQLTISANKKIQITVINQDTTPEEFESFDLDREQVVDGGKQITVYIGPLKPGTYTYWADYHKESTGAIVAQ